MAGGKNMDWWYDAQIKRYLIQLVRVFSHFAVREFTENGDVYNRIPVKYADGSRMVQHILRNNSENVIQSAPQITVGIQSIAMDRERSQEPFYNDIQQVAEREWDKQTNSYTSNQGNLYTLQRYMPSPYRMTIQVDIWTTNTDTKLQILEQLFVLFNPSIQLQTNDNPLDWSNVFEIELTDIQWSNRTIPAGVEEQLDIATLTFQVPIWISPPAKVTRQQIIQRIKTDVAAVDDIDALGYDSDFYDFFGDIPADAEVVNTPNDYYLQVVNGNATLVDNTGAPQEWGTLLLIQGDIRASSLLELNLSPDDDARDFLVFGSLAENPLDPTSLIFNLDTDTLPSNTIPNIDRIIDPKQSQPGTELPVADVGQRYLITQDIDVSFPNTWGVTATNGDILEYSGTEWTVSFDSSEQETAEFVTNSFSNQQFKWDGTQWISSWQGVYKPAYWRLIL
jgi:hypothetical protein